ncbi:rhodanese-like domain-containing protein [Luteococcus sp. Sow4_B9]|uniref:rhodanese-like domain-containing protein n=1 Tax=Luteococcus sp. Sow4_B9 TaxID=3438792 RepID=UPI003F9B20C7
MGLRDRLINRMTPEGGISVDEALQLLAKGGVLCDVRGLKEYEAGHVPGARLVDVRELAENVMDAVYGDDPFAEPGQAIVLICDTGLRSGHAVKLVRDQGMTCEFVDGGLMAWRESGQILIPGPPRPRR